MSFNLDLKKQAQEVNFTHKLQKSQNPTRDINLFIWSVYGNFFMEKKHKLLFKLCYTKAEKTYLFITKNNVVESFKQNVLPKHP